MIQDLYRDSYVTASDSHWRHHRQYQISVLGVSHSKVGNCFAKYIVNIVYNIREKAGNRMKAEEHQVIMMYMQDYPTSV